MRCPTCGKEYGIGDAHELHRVMSVFRVDCYQGADKNYYLERGRGQVERVAIDDALRGGLIKNRWDDTPPEVQYWTIVK